MAPGGRVAFVVSGAYRFGGGLLPERTNLLLQIRTRVLNDQLADDFHRWHPGFTHCSHDAEELPAAA